MDIETELARIFAEDDLGLLEIKPKVSCAKSADQRLVDSFEEINDFVGQYGNEPKIDGSVIEQKLAYRLRGIRQSTEKSASLSDYDRFQLLASPPVKEYESLDDILMDDEAMALLDIDDSPESIFKLKHVTATSLPDYISQRKPCKDFARYESIFKKCQGDLSSGRRQILLFSQGELMEEGHFYVLSGVLVYLENIHNPVKDAHGHKDGRTHCIFENGTESDMMLRSLSKGLYKDGRRVTERDERLLDGFKNIKKEDMETGYIYILKSLSTDAKIQSIENLYKIGFSTEPVEERIKNAEQEPTYLLAPVEIVDSFRCFNLNPQKLEQLLHNFFGNSCLNIDIFDKNGQRHTPREWFIAPYHRIYQAIYFIMNGDIVNYRYNSDTQEIVAR